MLEFICGGTYSKREEVFLEMVKTAAQSNKNVICIIPDQYSFEFDRTLYKAVGVKLFNRIRTIGFNRLSEILATKYGGSVQSCDDHIKTILMFRAIKALSGSGNVKFYRKNLDKPAFIGECLELVQSLRESGITPEMLKASAESHGGVLEAKLSDLSEIYRNFMEELDKNEMTDSLSSLARACEQADKNEFFKDTCVFISSFTSFTHDELRMCDIALSQCDDMTVSLVIDEDCVS
ncbi:MAG: ATP-dependent nuclease subunit B, partial [Ruminococcus sp.]|nr:ATP-dependent nuclease subunit B [Ruminococcus sp.]